MAASSMAAAAKKTKGVEQLKQMLNAPSVMEQFQNALQKNASTFVASIIDLYNSDSKLQLCEPRQVIMEALKAAVLHLPINKALGYAYVIPFYNSKKVNDVDGNGNPKVDATGRAVTKWVKVYEPTFQIGYKGLIQLAIRTGQYRTINADVVYEGELRKVSKLKGEIAFDGEKKSDKVIGYFCYFELMNGFSKSLFMSTEQMAAHAKLYSPSLKNDDKVTVESLLGFARLPVSQESKTIGWTGNFHKMAIKTVIRNLLSQYGYLSTEMQNAIAEDYEAEIIETPDSTAKNGSGRQVLDMIDATYEEVANDGSSNANSVNEPDY